MAGWSDLRAAWEPRILSILRVVAGLLYMQHGLNKFIDFPPTAHHAPYHLVSLVPGLAAILETFGGALIVLGLFTPLIAFILSGEMAFAYFMFHAKRGFFPLANAGDEAILFCFVYLYLVFAGGGSWSLDAVIRPAVSPKLASRR